MPVTKKTKTATKSTTAKKTVAKKTVNGEGHRYYTKSPYDDMTLSAPNEYGAKNVWEKGEWR